MKAWITSDVRGSDGMRACCLVVAYDDIEAMKLLLAECEAQGIPQDADDIKRIKLVKINTRVGGAQILLDGYY